MKLSDILLLGIAAAFWPLGVMARNLVGIADPERLIAVVFVVWIAALLISWSLIRLGLSRTVVIRSAFIATVLAMTGGRVLRELGPSLGWAALLLILALAVVVFWRLDDSGFLPAAIAALAVALVSGVLISLSISLSQYGTSQVVVSAEAEVALESRPDVFVVLVDGYPGRLAWELDAASNLDDLNQSLVMRGFQVPKLAWSSYWITDLSLASLLDMAYPVEVPFEGDATTRALYDMIGGDNNLISLMRRNGYETYMVESGWGGGSCGPRFDFCVPSPFLDDGLFFMLSDTVVGPAVFSEWGSAFTVGTEQSMAWLLGNGPALSRDDKPSFVFAHLVVPHAPFFLDERCDRVVSVARAGTTFNLKGVPESDRQEYLAQQAACVDRFLVEFADSIDSDDVVVFVADHGTDRRDQIRTPGTAWDQDDFVERMNVFVAARVADGCDIGEEVINPNLLRRILSCYSASPLEDLPSRFFLPGMIEVDGFGS